MDNKKNIERLEKAAEAVEKAAEVADQKLLSKIPGALGSHKSKVMVAMAIVLVIGLMRDGALVLFAGLVLLLLYSKSVVSAVKEYMAKVEAEKAAKKLEEEKAKALALEESAAQEKK